MKKKVLELKCHNWGLIGPRDWSKLSLTLYDDCSVEKSQRYIPNCADNSDNFMAMLLEMKNEFEGITEPVDSNISKDSDSTYNITEAEFAKLKLLIEDARNVEKIVEACDGVAWEFKYYENNQIVWERSLGYIYGIEELERIVALVDKN